MTEDLKKLWNSGWLFRVPVFILLLTFFVASALWLGSRGLDLRSDSANLIVAVWSVEDPNRNLTIEKIVENADQRDFNENFMKMPDSTLSIGQSTSYWWLRFTTKLNGHVESPIYFTVKNPTVEEVAVYVPFERNGVIEYEEYKAGWGVRKEKKAMGHMSPTLVIPVDAAFKEAFYIRLYSSYSQNYSVALYHSDDFMKFQQINVLIIGLFSGIMIAVILINAIHWFVLKDRVYLSYVLYILLMLVYQGVLMGAVKLTLWEWADWMMANITCLGILVMMGAIWFTKTYFNTPEKGLDAEYLLNGFMILLILNLALLITPLKQIAIWLSIFGGLAGISVIVRIAIIGVRKGYPQSGYFFAGWVFMLLSYLLFMVRIAGLIPDHLVTRSIMLLAVCLESILMSAGLSGRFKTMRLEKENAQTLVKSAEVEVLTKETAFLQAQIKPHFLYNAFNIIAVLCLIKPEKARELVLDLSRFLHHSFNSKNQNRLIAFEEELDFVNAYVKIEQARFKDQIEIRYAFKDVDTLMVPPLILQPLVENAIRHGLRKKRGPGVVNLRVEKIEDYYQIEVEDNGAGMSEERILEIMDHKMGEGKEEGIGLYNIQKRLQLNFGSRLVIESQLGLGTKVTYRLPAALAEKSQLPVKVTQAVWVDTAAQEVQP